MGHLLLDWSFDRVLALNRLLKLGEITLLLKRIMTRVGVEIWPVTLGTQLRAIHYGQLIFCFILDFNLCLLFGHFVIDRIVNILVADDWLWLLIITDLLLLLLVLVLTLAFEEIDESLLLVLIHLLELRRADKQIRKISKFLLLLFDLDGLLCTLLLRLVLIHLMLIVVLPHGRFCSQFCYNGVIDGYLKITVRVSLVLGLVLLLLVCGLLSATVLPVLLLRYLLLWLRLLTILVHVDVDNVFLLYVAPNRNILMIDIPDLLGGVSSILLLYGHHLLLLGLLDLLLLLEIEVLLMLLGSDCLSTILLGALVFRDLSGSSNQVLHLIRKTLQHIIL